jgi:hypothetical protein
MTPLHQRIVNALRTFEEYKGSYAEVMYKVWPHDKYPRAMRGSHNGGPPGCAFAFGRALREMEAARVIWRPSRHLERYGQPNIQLLSKHRENK